MENSNIIAQDERSECELSPMQDKVVATNSVNPGSMVVMRHGISSPAPEIFSPTEAKRRAMRVGKRKASRWVRMQYLEAKVQHAVTEKDLEKQMHQQTRLQMQREVVEARARAVRAERAAIRARRRIAELEAVNVERNYRARNGELALQILGLQVVDFLVQVAVGYVGGKLVRMADVQLARGVRALLRR